MTTQDEDTREREKGQVSFCVDTMRQISVHTFWNSPDHSAHSESINDYLFERKEKGKRRQKIGLRLSTMIYKKKISQITLTTLSLVGAAID